MGSRTVRLDEQAEQALQEIRRATGMTISQALKKGLLALRGRIGAERAATAWEVYERLDLGPGGTSMAPASRAKKAVREKIGRKHGR